MMNKHQKIIRALKRLLHIDNQVFLIVDGCLPHRSCKMADFIRSTGGLVLFAILFGRGKSG